ncbi:PepSY domain-containing protein [Streptomyces sp. NPDC046862]|uniref:PepSY domain-containing protein n=1 Tax=Streptomyces sp. NPDC046862 TaxID=3154603 RepID=UPI0034546C3C
MNTPQRALAAAVSTAALLVGLVACGGSDSGDSASSSNSAAAGQAGGDTQAAGGDAQAEGKEGKEGGDPVETPLTGEAKKKAEAAALAAFPGTVVKSEEDAENPGTYAVEIKKADGSEVEVYLDPKTYKVLKTKDEAGDDD